MLWFCLESPKRPFCPQIWLEHALKVYVFKLPTNFWPNLKTSLDVCLMYIPISSRFASNLKKFRGLKYDYTGIPFLLPLNGYSTNVCLFNLNWKNCEGWNIVWDLLGRIAQKTIFTNLSYLPRQHLYSLTKHPFLFLTPSSSNALASYRELY